MSSLVIDNKSVFPIVSLERRGNYTYDENYHSLDTRIQPLTIKEITELRDSGFTVPEIVNEGAILMRHPYLPNTIVEMNLDNTLYLQEKFGDYAVILNYLGAKKQTLKAIITKLETRKIEADGKMRCRGKFSLKGTFKRFTAEGFEVKYSQEITASNDCKYKKAKEYAEKVGLINDPFVRAILANRKDQLIDTYHADTVISKDYNDIIDAAASLQVMGGVFGLDGTFNRAVSIREQVSISQDLYFI